MHTRSRFVTQPTLNPPTTQFGGGTAHLIFNFQSIDFCKAFANVYKYKFYFCKATIASSYTVMVACYDFNFFMCKCVRIKNGYDVYFWKYITSKAYWLHKKCALFASMKVLVAIYKYFYWISLNQLNEKKRIRTTDYMTFQASNAMYHVNNI